MKQSALALAVLAAPFLSSIHARAQDSVQLYGRLDAGVEVVNHMGPDDATLVRVVSGGKNTSRWGIRGSEDLGGGLKAVFNFEGEVALDTGDTEGKLFKRHAWVGLEGGFGRVVIGRSFTTTYDLVIKFDPMGFAPHYSWATSGSATSPSKYGMTTAFDNQVKYSGRSGGFTYGASLGLGEGSGSSADGRKFALGGSWFGGGLGFMAACERINGVAAAPGLLENRIRDRTRACHLGADYRTGDWRYTAGLRAYALRPAAGGADLRANTWWGGITREIDRVTLTGALYHIDTRALPAGRDADPTMLVLRAMLALSPRTDLYLSAAHARADHDLPVGLSRDDPGAAPTQSGITAGIQHRF